MHTVCYNKKIKVAPGDSDALVGSSVLQAWAIFVLWKEVVLMVQQEQNDEQFVLMVCHLKLRSNIMMN